MSISNNMMAEIMNDAKENKKSVVRDRYCDIPMARKKKLLPCEKNCTECIACIEVMMGGEKKHVVPRLGK